MRWVLQHRPWIVLALIVAVSFGGAAAITASVPRPRDEEFNIVRWEVRHLPGKWLYLTDRFFRGRLSPEEEDGRLGRYLILTARIQRLGLGGEPLSESKQQELDRLISERDSLENDVEAILEGRLTAVLEDAGLESSVPLFPGARLVFPPVDFELDRPLRVVSVSRRDRIELLGRRTPLSRDITLEDATEMEERIEEGGDRSALAETVTGAAAYPSIIAPRSDYRDLAETVAHEWVHHYLFFQPLGQRYLSSLELRTINETVASLVGAGLADILVDRYPLLPDTAAELDWLSLPAPQVDVSGELRQLRLDVELLLGRGQIEAAERLMEERRVELQGQGAYFRRINQAFFAARDLYADDPMSIDPLGFKLVHLRRRIGTVGAFLRAASRLTGGDDLDRLLAAGASAR